MLTIMSVWYQGTFLSELLLRRKEEKGRCLNWFVHLVVKVYLKIVKRLSAYGDSCESNTLRRPIHPLFSTLPLFFLHSFFFSPSAFSPFLLNWRTCGGDASFCRQVSSFLCCAFSSAFPCQGQESNQFNFVEIFYFTFFRLEVWRHTKKIILIDGNIVDWEYYRGREK